MSQRFAGEPDPVPLKLISSMAAREVLAELAQQYQAATGQAVQCEAAGGVDVAKRVAAGEAVDVVVLASNAVDKLLAEGRLLTGSRVDLAKSGVGVAVPAGSPRPDIRSEDAVKQAVFAAATLSYSTGPSGVYLEKVFERWGILEQIRSRIVVPPPGIPVATLVANGSAALGFQQLSELLNQPGVELVGSLPPALQITTIFSGGISQTSANPRAARTLLTYMAAPEAAAIKERHGMEGA
jgi:molybdate transport system substrate-binding protein